jgi:hypothetical protein
MVAARNCKVGAKQKKQKNKKQKQIKKKATYFGGPEETCSWIVEKCANL